MKRWALLLKVYMMTFEIVVAMPTLQKTAVRQRRFDKLKAAIATPLERCGYHPDSFRLFHENSFQMNTERKDEG